MTFHPGAVLDPAALEEAVRIVGFTATGVRAWIEGRFLSERPPAAAPDESLLFVAAETGQRFIVVGHSDVVGPGQLRAEGATVTIWGKAETVEGRDDVLIDLEGFSESR